jgi:hypothetical protein
VEHLLLVSHSFDFEYFELNLMFIGIDHTSLGALGHFLFVEPYGREPGDEAHLISPAYNSSQPRCLRIWYHLYGIKPGTLQIRQQPEVGQTEVLWSKSINQGTTEKYILQKYKKFILPWFR